MNQQSLIADIRRYLKGEVKMKAIIKKHKTSHLYVDRLRDELLLRGELFEFQEPKDEPIIFKEKEDSGIVKESEIPRPEPLNRNLNHLTSEQIREFVKRELKQKKVKVKPIIDPDDFLYKSKLVNGTRA